MTLSSPELFYILSAIIVIVLISLLMKCFFTVEQQSASVVERFGKYTRTAHSGLNFKIPFVDLVREPLSLRVQQLNVQAETKTQDNVFVKVVASVQYQVIEEKVYEAYYKLQSPEQQINAFVFDVVRARVPKMKLDDLFEKKDEIADAVKIELAEIMSNMGYLIVKALVTDIDPDAKVKAAMNEINEAQRLRVAAQERGEADKIIKVKQAEAEAESAALQGKGMAEQRRAIIQGFQDSVADFQAKVTGLNSESVMSMVLATQYMDMMKSIGSDAKTNTIMLPHSPAGMTNIMDQLRNVLVSSNQVPRPDATTKTQGTAPHASRKPHTVTNEEDDSY